MPVYLALEFGRKRIGVAVGDSVTGTARALPVLAVPGAMDWKRVERCIADWRPAALVVGLPLDEDGAEQDISREARKFARELSRRQSVPVHLADERYSSRSADEALREARASGRMNRRVRKGDRDGEAARVILEQWMAEQAATATRSQ